MSYDREAVYQKQIQCMLGKAKVGTVLNPVAEVECRSCNKNLATQSPIDQLAFLYLHPGHVTFVYPKGKLNSPQAQV